MSSIDFSSRLLQWFDQHGRRDLPWQHPRSPYFVWLSEVMLQQTQVASVIGYFKRFTERFPDLDALADAHLDEVLNLWAGLGYYSRARNLHACAKHCQQMYGGSLPQTLEELIALPGIGRSTAAAILSQAFDQPAAILDGNVKRVLARQLNILSEINHSVTSDLWAHAQARLPNARAADYTQAIMDLGALICVPKKPRCADCPVQGLCQAFKAKTAAQIPAKKAKKVQPQRYAHWLIVRDEQNQILLQRRPDSGIWGGLYTLPEADARADFEQLDLPVRNLRLADTLPVIKHVFTHFQLFATPHLAHANQPQQISANNANTGFCWIELAKLGQYGLPAPVKKLLTGISGS